MDIPLGIRRAEPSSDGNPLFSKAGDPSAEPPPEPPAPPPRRKRHVIAVVALGIVILLGLASAGLYLFVERLGDNVARVPGVFGMVDRGPRPPVLGTRMSFLVVGTDSRAETEQRATGGEMRMLARIDISEDRKAATVVSIPRDSVVEIPGRGRDRIDAAYNSGGPPLLVQTVERLTNVRIDHFAVIDFNGFRDMVDAVGGIDMEIGKATGEAGVRFAGGLNHFDGAQALTYLREGDSLRGGGADQASRQQNALRAVLDQAATSGLLGDPIQLYDLLDAVTRAVSVDDTLSNNNLRGLGIELRNLRSSGVQFVVAPTAGVTQQGGLSYTYLDEGRSAELWGALRADTVAAYVKEHPDDALGTAPR